VGRWSAISWRVQATERTGLSRLSTLPSTPKRLPAAPPATGELGRQLPRRGIGGGIDGDRGQGGLVLDSVVAVVWASAGKGARKASARAAASGLRRAVKGMDMKILSRNFPLE
jgi:hypothetical protein